MPSSESPGTEERRPRAAARKLLVGLVYAWTAALVLFVFVQHPGVNGYDRAMFGDMVYGRAHQPFVTRPLVPWSVH